MLLEAIQLNSVIKLNQLHTFSQHDESAWWTDRTQQLDVNISREYQMAMTHRYLVSPTKDMVLASDIVFPGIL